MSSDSSYDFTHVEMNLLSEVYLNLEYQCCFFLLVTWNFHHLFSKKWWSMDSYFSILLWNVSGWCCINWSL